MPFPKLDAKFYGQIRKVKDGTTVPDDEYMVFLVKDNAFAAILPAYRDKCIELGCDDIQVGLLNEAIRRVDAWRVANPDRCKDPDAEGERNLYNNPD